MALGPRQAPPPATAPAGERAASIGGRRKTEDGRLAFDSFPGDDPNAERQTPSALRAARRAHLWAAGLAGGAGLVHALAGEGHFAEWWGYGLFFLAVSICQFVGGAALLFWNDRRLYWTGLVGTGIVLLIWTISRTVGVPIGPDGAGPERIGVLDGISVVLEVALIWYLVQLVRHPGPAPLDGVLAADDV